MENYQSAIDELMDAESSETVELDAFYSKGEVLENVDTDVVSSPLGYSALDLYRVFSAEINTEDFYVRTPEQQDEWARSRTEAVKKLGRLLLKIRSVRAELLQHCLNNEGEKLFGCLKTKGGKGSDKDIISISYSPEIQQDVIDILQKLDSSDSSMLFDDAADTILIEYNLNYSRFIQPVAQRYFAEFSRVKSIEEEYQRNRDVKQNMTSLFDSPNSAEARELIDKYEMDWRVLKNLMTTALAFDSIVTVQKNKLVNTNLRLCISLANKVYKDAGGDRNESFSKLDLINEGVIGLMKAVDMYVYGVKAKVTTYAYWWVNQKITRYVKNNNPVRIPVHVYDLVNKILATVRVIDKNKHESETICAEYEKSLRSAVEEKLGPILNETWEIAMLRYRGVSLSLSCVTRDADIGEGELTFDYLDMSTPPPEEENVDELVEPSASSRIMAIAEGMVAEDGDEDDKDKLTKLQFDLIYKQFVKDMTNKEIAINIGWEDYNEVRKEINRGLSKIRRKLKGMDW